MSWHGPAATMTKKHTDPSWRPQSKGAPLGCNKGTMYLTLGKTKASIQATKQGGPVSEIKKMNTNDISSNMHDFPN
jgi:hypothetical protein